MRKKWTIARIDFQKNKGKINFKNHEHLEDPSELFTQTRGNNFSHMSTWLEADTKLLG